MSDGEKFSVCYIAGKPRGELNAILFTGFYFADELGDLIQAARIIVFFVVQDVEQFGEPHR